MYEYRGYALEVSVEAVRPDQAGRSMLAAHRRYAAIVTFAASDRPFETLRLSEAGGLPFSVEVDALMGGYSAAQRVIDDHLDKTGI